MNYYSIALFLHMAGALGFFVALGLEWASLWQMRRAITNEQIRKGMRLFSGVRRAGMASMTVLILSGLYMAITAWGHVWWTVVALGTLILLYIPAAVLTGMRMAEVKRALAMETGSVSPSHYPLLHHPLLQISIQTRVAMALGILFLMNTKPDLNGALLAIGIATVLGLASALPLPRRERMRGQPAE